MDIPVFQQDTQAPTATCLYRLSWHFGLQQERNLVILFCNTSIDESILELQTLYSIGMAIVSMEH